MFRIGEFSTIARVSGRLLRYYDSIGLLSPQHVDQATGYRYYTAGQLERLNRILALKDLGLSLDQVARMLDDKVSTDEIRGMLMLKKAELERSLSEEADRLRNVESRLLQIDEQGSLGTYDIVVKASPAQPWLSIRRTLPGMSDAIALVREVVRTGLAQLPASTRDKVVVVAYSDYDDEDLDLEVGFSLVRANNKKVTLPGGAELQLTELPAVDTMAGIVRSGPMYQAHIGFGALGLWMEANRYRMAGPSREVFLEPPFQRPGDASAVMEIQFPVAKAA
jgi:DNA-binding transcriptional MerR regulator